MTGQEFKSRSCFNCVVVRYTLSFYAKEYLSSFCKINILPNTKLTLKNLPNTFKNSAKVANSGLTDVNLRKIEKFLT